MEEAFAEGRDDARARLYLSAEGRDEDWVPEYWKMMWDMTARLRKHEWENFRVQTDPLTGRLTLEEIDLDSVEGVHGGLDEKAWRSKFAQVYHQLAHIEKQRRSIPSYFQTASGPYVEQLDQQEEYWLKQLDELEDRATRVGVPASWRSD